jgi:prepilin-type N-terminal cleavage/methylation domain-containing protein
MFFNGLFGPTSLGFTLLELLIVIAIILVLISIALPNFLVVQTRAKVCRARAELRTACVAIESYQADWKDYPIYDGVEKSLPKPVPNDGGPHFLPYNLTTPVSYLEVVFEEIFHQQNQYGNTGMDPLPVHPFKYFTKELNPKFVAKREQAVFGKTPTAREYVVWAVGPCNDCNKGLLAYNPTNGTDSTGDLMRWGP